MKGGRLRRDRSTPLPLLRARHMRRCVYPPNAPSIFHHLITLPTYHDTALGTDTLAEGYFGDMGMLAYVKGVQRKEIRRNQPSVKHQDLAGSNIGDKHKEYFSGDNALLAGGEANTMNQF